MVDSKKILGSNIRLFRKSREMSQEQLAEAVEISVKHLSNIELGKRFISSRTLNLVSETLDVPLHYLFIDRSIRGDSMAAEKTRTLLQNRSIAFAHDLMSELGLYHEESKE